MKKSSNSAGMTILMEFKLGFTPIVHYYQGQKRPQRCIYLPSQEVFTCQSIDVKTTKDKKETWLYEINLGLFFPKDMYIRIMMWTNVEQK